MGFEERAFFFTYIVSAVLEQKNSSYILPVSEKLKQQNAKHSIARNLYKHVLNRMLVFLISKSDL